jgi:hypothetical protein
MSTDPPVQTPTLADGAIAYALAQVGKPYIWGGTGPAGYDCSGLTSKAYAAVGVTIPRTAIMQMRTGTAIPNVAAALPGDLIFPYADGSHVVMYLGNNTIVEAPTAGEKVQVVAVYKSAGGIRRIVAGGGTVVGSAVLGSNPPAGNNGGSSGAQITNIFNSLTNPKEWASIGIIVFATILIGIAVWPMISKNLSKVEMPK